MQMRLRDKAITMPRPAVLPRRPGEPSSSSRSQGEDRVDFHSIRDSEATEASPIKSKWTILNYSAGDNNLYAYIYDDVASMEALGSSASVQLVSQLDHRNGGAYRFRIEADGPNSDPRRIDSPVLESLGPVNMSDSKTLADFIAWGMKKFPSERTMLVITDHGKGWEGAVEDESHKGWMKLPELKQALEMAQARTGKKLDVIGFDACQMATVEVASQIKDHAKYMVASQALEGKEGWPYQHLLTQASLGELKQAHLFKSDVQARQVAEMIVQATSDHQEVLPTMSAVDLEKVPALEQSLARLAGELSNAGISGKELRTLRSDTQAFGFVYDLGDFLTRTEQLAQQQNLEGLRAAVQQCQSNLAKAVVARQSSSSLTSSSGLSVELKRNTRQYSETEFDKEVQWSKMFSAFARQV